MRLNVYFDQRNENVNKVIASDLLSCISVFGFLISGTFRLTARSARDIRREGEDLRGILLEESNQT